MKFIKDYILISDLHLHFSSVILMFYIHQCSPKNSEKTDGKEAWGPSTCLPPNTTHYLLKKKTQKKRVLFFFVVGTKVKNKKKQQQQQQQLS